jgi:hypothetical protein
MPDEEVLMSEPWWPIYRINFSKYQMRFLIENLGALKVGRYPPRPEGYSEPLKMACKKARNKGYNGYCIACPFGMECLSPRQKTPNRVRKEPAQNRVLELAAEVECRLELVLDYISGWPRPDKKIRKRRSHENTV